MSTPQTQAGFTDHKANHLIAVIAQLVAQVERDRDSIWEQLQHPELRNSFSHLNQKMLMLRVTDVLEAAHDYDAAVLTEILVKEVAS